MKTIAGVKVSDRAEFRKLVRKYASEYDLSYIIQEGSYVFPDGAVVSLVDNVVTFSKTTEQPQASTTKTAKERKTKERKTPKTVVNLTHLYDYTYKIVAFLVEAGFVVNDKMQEEVMEEELYGFDLVSLYKLYPTPEEATKYVLDRGQEVLSDWIQFMVRGEDHLPKILIIGTNIPF